MTKREAVIIGVGDVPLKEGKVLEPMTPLQVQALAAHSALHDAGIEMQDVDGLLVANTWGIPGAGQVPTITMAEYFGITPRFVDGTSIGGAAFEAHGDADADRRICIVCHASHA